MKFKVGDIVKVVKISGKADGADTKSFLSIHLNQFYKITKIEYNKIQKIDETGGYNWMFLCRKILGDHGDYGFDKDEIKLATKEELTKLVIDVL